MPGPYKGYLTQRTTQQKYTQPRHQPSDRDQKALQCLKAKASRAQICSTARITLAKSVLQTIQRTFDPGFPVSLHLSPLQTSAEEGTIPILYIIHPGRHCMPTTNYYFSSIKPDSIIIPPCPENNDTLPAKQHN